MTDTAEPAFDGLTTHDTTSENKQSSRTGGNRRGAE
jgi:hypothetical protein